mmetsp:Transcript_1725/g.3270  ORF Transcript_1725/g.3270 Transcript_1725/m.3270 type:complete len:138 (-) Transcript_1725:216-629(-)
MEHNDTNASKLKPHPSTEEFVLFDSKVPEPWKSYWKKFIGDDVKKEPIFNLDKHIDIVLGGLFRFLANPRVNKSSGLYGPPGHIQMRDINLYCRKLPQSIRPLFIKRLEQILNNEGYSLGQGDEAQFNAGENKIVSN